MYDAFAFQSLDRLERPGAAALLIEQPRKHRRAVESRQAQPVDVGIGADQRQDPAVADRTVMQRQRRLLRAGHRTGSIRQAAISSELAQSNTVCDATRSRSARIRRR